jgi:nicotinate-nucleotide pyrophosphorylase (carboxylating)
MALTHAVLPSPAELSPLEVSRVIETALAEDLAAGDVTTRTVVPPGAIAEGTFGAREPLVVAGVGVAAAVFARLDPRVEVAVERADGARVAAREVIARVRGPAHAVLTGERVALNLLQRMSGVATRTRAFVDALPPGSRARVTDTRKTTPGLRALERYAVRCGGGVNHRNDLGAGVLIKDNHIVLCGGVGAAVARARAGAPHPLRIEVEVDSLAMFDEAVAAAADVILLDNFDEAQVREAVARVAGRAPRPVLEISGGVTLERIPALGALGVDVISSGALTHSARGVDIGLDLAIQGAWTD